MQAKNEAGATRSQRIYAAGCLAIAALLLPVADYEAEAKTPGHQYCFRKVCHRVKTIEETRASIGRTETLVASYYDDAARDRFNPSNQTSSGERFFAGEADNAASPIYPDGTKLLVWHPGTRHAAVVRINNAGPYHGKRLLDLSRGAAERLGLTKTGVATLHAKVVYAPTREEASYKRGRRYAPVPGFIGAFASLTSAFDSAMRALGMPAPVNVAAASTASTATSSTAIGATSVTPPPEMGQAVVASASAPAHPSRPEPAPAAQLAAAELATPFVAASKPAPARVASAQRSPRAVRSAIQARRSAGVVATKAQQGKAGKVRLAALSQVPSKATVKTAHVAQAKPARAVVAQKPRVEQDEDADSAAAWSPRVLEGEK